MTPQNERTFRISVNQPCDFTMWVRGPINRLRTTLDHRCAGDYPLGSVVDAVKALRSDLAPGYVITVF